MTNWILACDGSNPEYPFGFACKRCGKREALPRTLPVHAYLAWAESFRVLHESCEESVLDAPDKTTPEDSAIKL